VLAVVRPRRYRAAVDVSGTLAYLSGDWHLERQISDYRTGQHGVFRGQARFLPSADDDQVLEYREDGELEFGGYCGPATRSLIYRGRSDGGADVRFADGREFYRLDLRSASCEAEHPCRADQYLVTVTRRSPVSFTETWRVAGPGKDYELAATYTRPGAE
jgi:Family of unknown function (DUF6314)